MSESEPHPAPSPRRPAAWLWAFAGDVLLVLVFATIGRASHERGISVTGVLETAWPFLAALIAGWLVLRAWAAPAATLRTGLPLWTITVAGGMALRALSGSGVALPFILVAAATLLLLLVGWRLAAGLVVRGRSRRAAR